MVDVYKNIIEGNDTEDELFYELQKDDTIKQEIEFAEIMRDIKKKYPSLCCFSEDLLDNYLYTVWIGSTKRYLLDSIVDYFNSSDILIIEDSIKYNSDYYNKNKIQRKISLKSKDGKDGYTINLDINNYYFSDLKEAKEFLKEQLSL